MIIIVDGIMVFIFFALVAAIIGGSILMIITWIMQNWIMIIGILSAIIFIKSLFSVKNVHSFIYKIIYIITDFIRAAAWVLWSSVYIHDIATGNGFDKFFGLLLGLPVYGLITLGYVTADYVSIKAAREDGGISMSSWLTLIFCVLSLGSLAVLAGDVLLEIYNKFIIK